MLAYAIKPLTQPAAMVSIAMNKKTSYPDDWPDIDTTIYDRSLKLFRLVKNMLGVKIKLHAESQPEQGDIFLFNHFSRFETFIPQFLIHERTSAYSCAIAASEFFETDNALARYLKNVGVSPMTTRACFPCSPRRSCAAEK